jgi:hypothetical protein
MGKMEFNAPYRHDRSLLLVVRCTEASHACGTDGHSSRLHVLWRRIPGYLRIPGRSWII